jgi:hypothetical protein
MADSRIGDPNRAALANDIFSGTIELKALHSTARKGVAIRADHFGRNLAESGDENEFNHVTPFLALRDNSANQLDRTKIV